MTKKRESGFTLKSFGASVAKIESIQACTVRIPLDRVTSFATRTAAARDYGLVRVRTTDGAEGLGFGFDAKAIEKYALDAWA